MAFATYFIWCSITVFGFLLGLTSIALYVLVGCLSGIFVCNISIYAIIRTGFNKRFKDPSLTLIQMLIATFWTMVVLYFATSFRSLVLLLYLVVFVFGLFKLRRWEFLFLSLFAVVNYSLVILLLYKFNPASLNIRIDILNIVILATVLPWFSLVGGYITHLRTKISNALSTISQMTDNIHDVIFVLDMNLNYTYVSPSVKFMRGYEPEEVLKQTLVDAFTPSSLDLAMRTLSEFVELEKSGHKVPISQTLQLEIRRKNRTTLWTETKISFIRDKNQQSVGILGVIRDITERKQAEEERNSLQERLQRAEKMEAMGTLAGGVAHDLNNVLGVLVGFSELLAEKLPNDSPLRRYADNILKSSMRGAAIIQDLLTLARRGVNISEVVNLNKVVSDYLRTPEFEKLKSYHTGVNIRTDLENGLLNIKGSPIHLGKTIMNLISNAIEAISDKGEVTIKTENRYLDQPIQGYDEMAEGDYVVLMVSDTGSGISDKDIGKIFEPFYTKKVMGRSGTGLGLAVVWGTVKDHNGYIDVQSEEDKGSIFTLYFPATRDNLTNAQEAISTDAYMGRGESILVVDDVQTQRELAVSVLERLGYQAEAVASGEEAIEYLKSKKADLMVLDMIMDPGIDGMETYRRILEISPGQKAIIVSGFSETDRVSKAQKMGAGAFVRKPYILEKIGLAVKKELDRK